MSALAPIKRFNRGSNIIIKGGKTMGEFVYLYRGGEAGRSPERMQQTMQKWMAWFKDLAENGHVIDRGQPLERAGKLVKGSKKAVIDGPFAEAKDVIGGFTLIKARDLDHAVELSKGCPIFEFEGAAERGLEEMRAIPDSQRLAGYPFYHSALGEFELRCGRQQAARDHFQTALTLARNPMERRFLENRAAVCGDGPKEQSC
jgi:hypothetical protein